MNILLTNDDGYKAEGINLLAKLLSKYGNVYVVAPKTVMSAKSVSIILDRPIEVKKVNDNLYVTDGTPADCVAFGLSSLKVKFDLVVSGINHGHNISYDTMYSGTIGACLQALTYKIPAMAVSCEHNFDIVTEHFDEMWTYIHNMKLLSTEYLLNINFPLDGEYNGIRETNIYYRSEATYYEKVKGDLFQAKRNLKDENCNDIKSDVFAVNHGYISISKLKKTLDL